ncbi:DEAD/DEAH box helicase [Rhizorhabdus phycosphaerae]|uniref:DEAD/DEAH box helicase n=1 Tax=Rhizorhabdus phycosphaerae TaxID=2711156 RepID=UPI0013EBCDD3|nr:DEAD/DEAH box helicase family protein [Rhizorhabdus phycosphaerae]
MELKLYQDRALDALRRFLATAKVKAPAQAYAETVAGADLGSYGRGGYTPVDGLEATPYCCLRLPTGGGKTLLAAHAIKVAADSYMDRPFVPVIWLVPSSAIQVQTLDALKQPRHPYRMALEEAFGGAVAVFDISERRQIRPKDFLEKTVIIVATYQAFRVEDKSDRNVYADDENLEDHFRDARMGEGLDVVEKGPRRGEIALSFANVLYRQRPLMILDEAHNFMTGLSGGTKARLNPAAIIELTATPKPKSNVIAVATAMELKAEDMIKMPVHLSQHGSWQQAIAHAVQNRAWLAGIAAKDPAGIRPIALYQAQPAAEGNEATVEAVKAHLIEVERIPEEAVVIATGDQRGLDGVNLFDPTCKVEHVITVQALKEGWDCSYAYVFCSLASIRAAGAVEQLLGRVLRMPFATRRASEELNRAYAHVSERSFAEAASGLMDRLIEMGFDERSAREAILDMPEQFSLEGGDIGPLYRIPEPVKLTVQERPDVSGWSAQARDALRMADDGAGKVLVVIASDASDEVKREIANAMEPIAPGTVEAVERNIQQTETAKSPAARGVPFAVPQLHIMVQDELELAYPESFVDLAGWDLLAHDADLPGFTLTEQPDSYEFDIEGDRLVYSHVATSLELALDGATHWDAAALARFLDKETRQLHTGQESYLEYCRRVVFRLVQDRGIPLAALVRGKYALKRAVLARVAQLRAETGRRGVQLFLDGTGLPDSPGPALHRFDPYRYEARNPYQGSFRFRKHYYAAIGDLKAKGEEFECAQAIDRLDAIKHWVRNVDRAPGAYRLPTSTDFFYPDFVAELKDGRQLVIEYKGRLDDDSAEKNNIGLKAEETSGGKLLFLMAVKQDDAGRGVTEQILHKLGLGG